MWSGIFPAVSTKFKAGDTLDAKEMERCSPILMDAGRDGIIVCDSLGEGPTLIWRKLEMLKIAQGVAGKKPVLMTVNEVAPREGANPDETVAIYRLIKQGRYAEALTLYRWFCPLLDLDVSTHLVQNIKLAEVLEPDTNDRVCQPRQPLAGERRAAVEKIVKTAIADRSVLSVV
ncbi:MAG: dihydrodipicolinate synthase family protein [Phyllobacterium sp.]